MPEEKRIPDFSTDEKQILRLSKNMQDLVATEGWREYEKVIKLQIADRERLVTVPLSSAIPAFEGMDFTTRAAHVEVVKGALIGLRLALDLPSATIKHASDIRAEHSPGVTTDD